jgi:hypothetical protein
MRSDRVSRVRESARSPRKKRRVATSISARKLGMRNEELGMPPILPEAFPDCGGGWKFLIPNSYFKDMEPTARRSIALRTCRLGRDT